MIDKVISHYHILQELGRGGMGEVYLAEDTKLHRQVALKFLPTNLTADKEARERFENEAQAAAALHHANIVTIHDIDEHQGQVFIAMEYVEGQTLKEMISGVGADPRVCPDQNGNQKKGEHRGSPLQMDQAINIAIQVGEGLTKAHEKGIVHRDIKPANIIISKDGVAKIVDFGLVKLKGQVGLTKSGTTLGTVAYMSPEQAMGKEVDQRSDIWSLGVVLYELLTGELPFKGKYEQAVIYAILNESMKPIRSLRADLPAEMEFIIEKAIAKDPAERYQHVCDLIAELKSLQKTTKPERQSGRTIFPHKKRRPPASIAFVVLSSILIAAISGYLLLKGKAKPGVIVKAENVKVKKAIAVIPFRDFSQAKDQDFFCYGMTDAINSRLAQIRELKVTSTTSVMRYKDTSKDIKDIGKELGVAYILEGTVQKESERIRLTAQLIDTANGFHVWSGRYDKKLQVGNIFDIQDEVSQAIAENLKMSISDLDLAENNSQQPSSIEAYNYYLKGMYVIYQRYLMQHNKEDFDEGVQLFSRVIELDANYALAYIGLAFAYYNRYLVETTTANPEELKKAIRYVEKAYQLNPDLAESKCAMGFLLFYRHDLDEAFKLFRQAVSKKPNNIYISWVIAYFYGEIGLVEQSVRYYEHCRELEPDFVFANYNLAVQYSRLGDFRRALANLDEYLSQASGELMVLAKYFYCYYLMEMKDLAAAEKRLADLEKEYPGNPENKYHQALLAAMRGDGNKALELYTQPDEELYALVGLKDKALSLIEAGVIKGDSYFGYLRLLHRSAFNNLRSDPRFQKILQQLKAIYDERVKKYGEL